MLNFAIKLKSSVTEFISFEIIFGDAIIFLWVFDEIFSCWGVLLSEEINIDFDGVIVTDGHSGYEVIEESLVIFHLHLAHYKSIMNMNFNIVIVLKVPVKF